jgi:hypothetical protein
MKDFYLPELHSFQYRAWAPWPLADQAQQDWVSSLERVDDWLVRCVGPHHSHWAWDRVDLAQQGNYLGVAFRWDKHRTLFLLRWSH